MQIPLTPPAFEQLIEEIVEMSTSRFSEILSAAVPPDPNGRYYHWDKLRHLKSAPSDLTHSEWWFAIKSARKSMYQALPHTAKDGSPFVFCEPKTVRRQLHEIDIHGGGELRASAQVANPNTRDTYLINSLIEEAITSSQLEGATTTRKVAKEMLRQKRAPSDRSEHMIVNNYHAMEYVNDTGDEELTPGMILELQRILTAGTLDNPAAVGNFRTTDDTYVGDERDSTIIHKPPPASEIPRRLDSICDFANAAKPNDFIHPVIRAVVLHFLLAYDHPFQDGNGRTARALFYWSMLRQGYWTMEFVSISRILKKAPAQYTRSYLYTETDENDVTYFIVHQLDVIVRAIDELFEYLERKSHESRDLEALLNPSSTLQRELNHRQLAVLGRATRSLDSTITIKSHRGAHNVTYDTARTDLLKLADMGFLQKGKRGKEFIFLPANNLKEAIKNY